MYRLRPATPDDYDSLYTLFVRSMKEHVAATWGWDEALQREHFKSHFDPDKIQIIVVDKRDVGMLSTVSRPHEIFLASIQILPEFQRRGFGTRIIQKLLEQGRRHNLPVTLQVLKVNRARELYERLGFISTGQTETHVLMKSAD